MQMYAASCLQSKAVVDSLGDVLNMKISSHTIPRISLQGMPNVLLVSLDLTIFAVVCANYVRFQRSQNYFQTLHICVWHPLAPKPNKTDETIHLSADKMQTIYSYKQKDT